MEKDINEAFKLYGTQTIDNLEFLIKDISKKDLGILQRILSNQNGNKIVLKNLDDKIMQFFQSIRDYTSKAHTMNCFVRSGYLENHLIVDVDLQYEKSYFAPINYPYLIKKNFFSVKRIWNLFLDNNKENTAFVNENNLAFGFNYDYSKPKKSIFLSNTSYLNNNNLEIEAMVKMSNATKDTKRGQTTSVGKIKITKNLEEKSFIFRDINELIDINRINLEIGHKTTKNRIDQYNCSPEIIANVPEQDSNQYIKASFEKFGFEDFRKNFHFYASSSLNNSINSVYLKNKLFLRKFYDLSSFIFQLNVELGLINSLTNKDIKIHEKFMINNFKGIVSPSKKVSLNENQTGDSLGIKSYLLVNKKLYLTDIPIFNNFSYENDRFQFLPFLHFNYLFTPEYLSDRENFKPYYFSSGFGLNFFCEYFAFEVCYNAYIKKNRRDLSSDFSFNFGID